MGNLAVGLSYGWWVPGHNRHHTHPNQVGRDSDLKIPVLAFPAAQTGEHRRFAAAAYRYQALVILPLLLPAAALYVEAPRRCSGGQPTPKGGRCG